MGSQEIERTEKSPKKPPFFVPCEPVRKPCLPFELPFEPPFKKMVAGDFDSKSPSTKKISSLTPLRGESIELRNGPTEVLIDNEKPSRRDEYAEQRQGSLRFGRSF